MAGIHNAALAALVNETIPQPAAFEIIQAQC
jgi:hypothetical protein